MDDQKSDVDVNVLVKLYNQRLSTLVNQNVFGSKNSNYDSRICIRKAETYWYKH